LEENGTVLKLIVPFYIHCWEMVTFSRNLVYNLNVVKITEVNMNLTQVRLNAGLTVAALAREAKVDRKTVDRAESGGNISEVKAYAIANALTRITGHTHTVQSLGIHT
jgi:DNA-binding XRE family transcriptional regulator